MWEWAIGILKVDHSTEANLRDEVVVEKEIGGGRYGKQGERGGEEENGA